MGCLVVLLLVALVFGVPAALATAKVALVTIIGITAIVVLGVIAVAVLLGTGRIR